jgi:hypothetical protein
MLALGMLLATGVLDWRADCLKGSPQAWDTLFWFSGMYGICAGARCSHRARFHLPLMEFQPAHISVGDGRFLNHPSPAPLARPHPSLHPSPRLRPMPYPHSNKHFPSPSPSPSPSPNSCPSPKPNPSPPPTPLLLPLPPTPPSPHLYEPCAPGERRHRRLHGLGLIRAVGAPPAVAGALWRAAPAVLRAALHVRLQDRACGGAVHRLPFPHAGGRCALWGQAPQACPLHLPLPQQPHAPASGPARLHPNPSTPLSTKQAFAMLPCNPAGVPPKLAALSLAYNVCINGAMTQYASGQVGGLGGRSVRAVPSSTLHCSAPVPFVRPFVRHLIGRACHPDLSARPTCLWAATCCTNERQG